MAEAEFIHLAVHTAYSLSEGAIHVKALPAICHEQSMPAVAMSDTNNMFAGLEFSDTLKGEGIQPIVGVTLWLKNPYIEVEAGSNKPEEFDHIRLYAQNDPGYRNLMVLVSKAHLDSGEMQDPHISFDDLKANAENLICLSGGTKGPLSRLIRAQNIADANLLALDFKALFGDRFYIELNRHGLDEQKLVEEDLLDIAFDNDIPIVATNDVYFKDEAMYEAHDALLCIAGGRYVTEDNRRRLTPEHRFKSAAEMKELFKDLPEAIENSVLIAKRCGFGVPKIDPILPNFAAGQEISEAEMLRQEAEDGLNDRLEKQVFSDDMDEAARTEKRKEYDERLVYELGIINQMGFPGYFLIVADFIQWSKDNDIPVGPGRGSGAGSLVAWVLKITDLDPLRFGLLFERFLNPERVSMPDFDIDFCQEKRERTIRYVQEKYGHDQVAQIITFGKLQARAVLRDVGRVMQMSYNATDRLCKLIPGDAANQVSLKDALEQEPKLKWEKENDELTGQVMERALKLEGLFRHASTHAAGVVIGDRPLDQLVPLYRDPRSDMPVTQFNMKWVEKAGLVKFDFLGLKTLTVIQKAVDFVAERGIHLDMEKVPLDDPRTFEMLSKGDTAGVFQLESAGMRQVLKGLKPNQFEDIIAVVALYRPGPMDMIPTYINRKHGLEEPDYLHPWLEPILKETYGVMIYQEQVMQIAQVLAGYSLGGADLLRRAMGKKIAEEMEAQRGIFIKGAEEKGVEPELSGDIFDRVQKFASYGFNKSHAAAYALVSYHTAYLKANYPVEFMAAIMSLDQNNTDKLAFFKKELQAMDIPLLPPDVNESNVIFKVERDPENPPTEEDRKRGLSIRYALAAIKSVGDKAMDSLVREREENGKYASLLDFAERVDVKQVNKRLLENLSAAGAFDSLAESRAQAYASVEVLMRHAQDVAKDRDSAQVSLFGEDSGAVQKPHLAEVDDWPQSDLLAFEKKAIGFYLSSHPLEIYEKVLKKRHVVPIPEAITNPQYWTSKEEQKKAREKGRRGERKSNTVRVAGAVEGYSQRRSKKTGKPFAYLTLTDLQGGVEALVFRDMLEVCQKAVEEGGPVIVDLEIQTREEDDSLFITVQGIQSLEDVAANTVTDLDIYIQPGLKHKAKGPHPLEALSEVLGRFKGGRSRISLYIPYGDNAREAYIELPDGYKLTPELTSAIVASRAVAEVEEK